MSIASSGISYPPASLEASFPRAHGILSPQPTLQDNVEAIALRTMNTLKSLDRGILYPSEGTVSAVGSELSGFEEAELRKKDSELWECLERKKQPEGHLYTYKFKPEFISRNVLVAKVAEIFPAIEPSISEVANSLGNPFSLKLLHELGYFIEDKGLKYSTEANIITIPDRDALLYRYNQLRTLPSGKWAHLPELSIISSEGIASDTLFVKALADNDGLISEGKEFIHDQMIHIIPLLMVALKGSSFYEEVQKEKTGKFQSYIAKINFIKNEISKTNSSFLSAQQSKELRDNLPILETLLGALVDSIAALEFTSTEELSIIHEFSLHWILHSPSWVCYLEKRYAMDRVLPSGDLIPKFNLQIMERLADFIDTLEIPASS